MSRPIGIDLGTTNSCVAILEGSEPAVLANSEGSRTTPSIVAFTESGERVVGQIAKRQAITNSENTVYAVKRLIGRKSADDEVQRMRQACPYAIVESPNGDARVRVRGRDYSPSEISAMVLAKMKKTAEEYLGAEVREAVITVPAYFDDAQRQATRDAGRIAGLEVLRIINEPTAAALAYGLETGRNERIAVYDLGGGTFDISILELREGLYEVRSTAGDTFLGGEDFDRRLIDWLAEQFADQHGVDLRRDRMALQRLKEAAEKAKHELSSAAETDVNLPFIHADASGPKHLNVTITRGKLEDLTRDLIERTLEPVRRALEDAGVTAREIEQVILVGGQTRMPRVQQVVADFFGKKPHKGVNPDEVVAVGAAIQASVLKGETRQVLLLDVTPLSLGVETAGGVFTRVIGRNTTIPCRKTEVFSTAVDNQPFVNVHVLQGERELARDNKSMAHFQLLGIPPAPRGVPQIEVAFEIDANGILSVAARDLGTGKATSVQVQSTSGLTEDEIQRLIAEADQHRDDDRRRREVVDLRNAAETLIYTTERALQEYTDVIPPRDRNEIEEDLAHCKKQLEVEDADAIRKAIQRLEGSSHRIAELMYAHVGPDLDGGGEGQTT